MGLGILAYVDQVTEDWSRKAPFLVKEAPVA